ncbi:MAG: Multidrug efflux pump subunit AcrB [Lentisphaerae bacterium ADurb.Bin242]|nr:MAG: Multidrug efflux pump subunit AcrB [Lentisphaerae bacterium ADurb.Bin242]
MSICSTSVVRPVLSVVLMLLVIVFGLIGLKRMPVREFPDIDVPMISITTTYEGASASVVETKITQIIEGTVAGIEGLDSIESQSRDGRSRITLEFSVSRDIDAAANDVRDRVSRILYKLPDESDSPVIAKYDSSNSPVMILSVTSSSMTRMELTDYVDRYLLDRFSVIEGVADASILGAQEQSMRIWLNRTAMAARGITVGDIENALESENVENPGGRIESFEREFVVRLNRQYYTPEDFRSMVLKRSADGNYIRLGDVAEVSLGPRNTRQLFTTNKQPMIGIGIYKQSTANTLTVSSGARSLLKELLKSLPEGMELRILRDESKFINASIHEVEESLVIAAVLVLLIIFLFLGSFRASLIPALSVPISLIGSFIVLYMFGYSINILTLLALVLAIGLVVDDTIVVLENIHRRIEEGEHPLLAAVRGSDQVIFAVLATTFVLAAVFMPICLWAGQTGRLFTEFAVAMTAAVCFSSVVALTFTPMLCSKLLTHKEVSFLGRVIEFCMKKCEHVYDQLLRAAARIPILILFLFLAICVLMVWGWARLPSEYEPLEDRGMVNIRMQAPEGTNFYTMNDASMEMMNMVYPIVESGEGTILMVVVPQFGDSQGAANTGFAMLELEEWAKRKRTSQQITAELRRKLAEIPTLKLQPFLPSGIGARGNPVQFVIGGPDYTELVRWRDILLEKAKTYPGLVDVDYDYKETTPQLHVEVDRERANELGVQAKVIGTTLETMLGSKQVTTFVDRGQEYDVVLQADRFSRATPSDLSNIYVRSSTSGQLVPLDNLVKIREMGDAGRLSRYNRMRAITITGNVAPGYALSDVLTFLEKTARENLPEYAQVAYKGQSKELKQTTDSMLFIFGLALLVSYLVLSAQFESFISPLIVMMTVPLGMIGAVTALYFLGMTMNIYTQIGIIMLIGLAAKNGILIVEFANQLRDSGHKFEEAVFMASKLRLRPILMTGISTVAGAIPLLVATGAGAVSRRCLGAVVFYGGTSACFLTLFVVPIGYLLLARWEKSPMALQKRLQKLDEENPVSIE